MKLRIDGENLVAEFGEVDRNWFGVTTLVVTIPLADVESAIAVHKMQRPRVHSWRVDPKDLKTPADYMITDETSDE